MILIIHLHKYIYIYIYTTKENFLEIIINKNYPATTIDVQWEKKHNNVHEQISNKLI